MIIIFLKIFFDQILLSPQVKQGVIISNKHGIYELPIASQVAERLKT